MAVDKLVDSAQLDADLSSVANAIRTKGGTSAQLAFPAGFVSAIDAISGGGGGGLVYETGTYTPREDLARPTISFANTHSEAPVLVLLSDQTGTASSATNSNHNFCYCDFYKLWGHGIPYSSSGFRYAIAYFSYRGTSTSSVTTASVVCSQNSDSTSASGTSYPRYWVSPTGFHPYSNSTSRYWRTGRTFKWIAVWKP